MGAFARQLCCRAHAPTYYNGAYLDLHAVIVRAELGYGQRRLLVKRQPTTPFQPMPVARRISRNRHSWWPISAMHPILFNPLFPNPKSEHENRGSWLTNPGADDQLLRGSAPRSAEAKATRSASSSSIWNILSSGSSA